VIDLTPYYISYFINDLPMRRVRHFMKNDFPVEQRDILLILFLQGQLIEEVNIDFL